MYLLVKQLHVACVALSIAGFAARGALMLAGSPLLQARFVRVAPHVVDTLLLASAVWLAWMLQQYPFVHGWLTAKVLGLVAYIVLGTVALRRGRTRALRAAAFVAALLAAAYVLAVAQTHDPRGPLLLLDVDQATVPRARHAGSMKTPLRATPVLFACRGCERDGPAREVTRALDRKGLGEAYAAGVESTRARARFPIYTIEGCEKACASAWLAGLGVTPSQSFTLGEKSIAEELERIARLAS